MNLAAGKKAFVSFRYLHKISMAAHYSGVSLSCKADSEADGNHCPPRPHSCIRDQPFRTKTHVFLIVRLRQQHRLLGALNRGIRQPGTLGGEVGGIFPCIVPVDIKCAAVYSPNQLTPGNNYAGKRLMPPDLRVVQIDGVGSDRGRGPRVPTPRPPSPAGALTLHATSSRPLLIYISSCSPESREGHQRLSSDAV